MSNNRYAHEEFAEMSSRAYRKTRFPTRAACALTIGVTESPVHAVARFVIASRGSRPPGTVRDVSRCHDEPDFLLHRHYMSELAPVASSDPPSVSDVGF